MWIETETGDLVNLDWYSRIEVQDITAHREEWMVRATQAHREEWVVLSLHATRAEARAAIRLLTISLETVSLRPAREAAP